MISFDLVSSTAKASTVFIEQKNVRTSVAGLVAPRSIVCLGQYNDDKTPTVHVAQRISSEGQEDTLYGRGSMLALMIKQARSGSNGSIPIYALPVAPHGSGVKAAGTITITGTATESGTLAVYIGGTRVTKAVTTGDTGAAITEALETTINALLDLPVTSNFDTPDLDVTAKNAGVVGNSIKIGLNLQEDDATPAGLTVTIVQLTSGANNPAIDSALTGLGNVLYTDIICPYVDSTSLTSLQTAWTNRISPEFKKMFAGFVPNNEAYSTYLATGTAQNKESVTFVPNFESNTLSYLIAAYVAGYAARWWQANPGRPIRGVTIPFARVPASFTNLSYAQKDALVVAGCTTLGVSPDNVFFVEDLCTTKKTNVLVAETPDWKFTETISNLQTKIYSMDQVFTSEPFLTGVVVDDDSTTDVAYAIRPKFVAAKLLELVDDLWIPRALSKNRDEIKASIVAEINSGNGGRIDTSIQDNIAAGLKIIGILYNWAIGGGN